MNETIFVSIDYNDVDTEKWVNNTNNELIESKTDYRLQIKFYNKNSSDWKQRWMKEIKKLPVILMRHITNNEWNCSESQLYEVNCALAVNSFIQLIVKVNEKYIIFNMDYFKSFVYESDKIMIRRSEDKSMSFKNVTLLANMQAYGGRSRTFFQIIHGDYVITILRTDKCPDDEFLKIAPYNSWSCHQQKDTWWVESIYIKTQKQSGIMKTVGFR
jgi:hypothetical protein